MYWPSCTTHDSDKLVTSKIPYTTRIFEMSTKLDMWHTLPRRHITSCSDAAHEGPRQAPCQFSHCALQNCTHVQGIQAHQVPILYCAGTGRVHQCSLIIAMCQIASGLQPTRRGCAIGYATVAPEQQAARTLSLGACAPMPGSCGHKHTA